MSPSFLEKLDKAFVVLERWLVVLFLSLIIVLAFLQILLRNIFSYGVVWLDPLIRQMVVWAGFLGACLATHQNKHITIDLLSRFLPAPWRKAMGRAIAAFVATISGFLAKASWTLLGAEKESGSVLLAHIPSWIFLIILPVAFGLICFHSLVLIFAREKPR